MTRNVRLRLMSCAQFLARRHSLVIARSVSDRSNPGAAGIERWIASLIARNDKTSKRFHRHHAGHGLYRAGDLRRDLETARQLDLDLAAVAEQQHHADLAVGRISSVARRSAALQPPHQAVDRRLSRKNTRSPFCILAAASSSGSTDWMRARTSSACTSAVRNISTAVARLQQVAILREPFGEQHGLVMPARIGQPDDAHLAAGLGAPLGARNHGAGDPAAAGAGFHRVGELHPGLHAKPLQRRRVIVERMTGEEETDRVEFLLQAVRQAATARPPAASTAPGRGTGEQFVLADASRFHGRAAPPPARYRRRQ